LSGLNPDTTYYFKSKAVGDGTGYGVEKIFTTQAEPDTTPPYTAGHDPAEDADNVPVNTNIVVHILDEGSGVDPDTIVMTVEGVPISPVITGDIADYTLTYDPPANFDFLQTVEVTVNAADIDGNVMTEDAYSFTTTESQTEYFYANQDVPVQNGGVTGSYLDTYTWNGNSESISERQSGGKPSNRYSYLEHKWTIPVTGGLQYYEFAVTAHHTMNTESDDFMFAYSTDDITYTDMVAVSKIEGDGAYQIYTFPQPISGIVYIRVVDTDRTRGNKYLDTINIDHMYIVGKGTSLQNRAPDAPADPIPSDGIGSVDTNPTLSVYAYDPDGNTMQVSFYDQSGVPIGNPITGVVSGSRVSTVWEGLDFNTEHGWYAVASDEEYSSQSKTWYFTTGDEVQPGSMYVYNISWVSLGVNLNSYVTVKWDSDGDGIAEASDEPVSGASVYYTLTHETASRDYVEITDASGQIMVQWKKAPGGFYTSDVTGVTHDVYLYDSELNLDNLDNDYTH
jgi:hypothetical protein